MDPLIHVELNVPVSFVLPVSNPLSLMELDGTERFCKAGGRRQSFAGPSGARPARQDKTDV
jgi:hypothetical protein